MSVLKSRRTESKAEYIYTANKIYAETIRFLSRLSARYSRLMSDSVAKLASEVVDNCEKANSIYPSSDMRKQLREKHLLEARASLMALDLHLFHIYDILITNPEGCFTTASGNLLKPSDAAAKLDKMSQRLGELIDAENALLTGLLKNNTSRQ